MTNEVKNVPELRFPGFEVEWLSYALKDVKDPKDKYSFTGGPFGSDLKKSDYKDNGIRIIQLQNINDGNFNDNYKIYTSSEKADILKSCNIYPGDIVIAKMADPLARATILPQNKENRYLMASDAIRLKVDDKSFNKIFMVNYINSRRFRRQAEDNSSGSTRMRIGLVTLGQLKISSPNKKEQDIIGDFFSKLDRQIELEEQKLEKLEEQKKGYMQKIFSQELRFKDENGNDYPEWEDKLISDIGKVVTGNTPSKKDNDYWNSNQYVWVTPTDISNKKNIYTSGYQLSQKGFSKARQLPKNTLLITCIASIGKNAILRIEGSCNQQINAVIPNDNYDVDYLYYAFEDVSKLMKSIAGKTATQIVNKAVFEKLLLNVPIYEEQQKISGFLNKVDILIDKQTQKIDELKLRKQGFLQKMFV